jgi:malate dehydrogenase
MAHYNTAHMTTVAIMGAGELGGAVAHALATRDRTGRVLLVDAAGQVAAGKALDIQQAGPVDGYHTRLEGTTDDTRITGCRVCVIADRFGAKPPEWQGDEALTMVARVAGAIGDAPLVFAGAAHAELIGHLSREARIPRERLIGSAPEALAAAVRAIVAMEARCSSTEVSLTVLGVPPSGFVVPWSEASIGGYALDRVLSQVQLTRVEARAARLWPPGPYALGAAAARVTEAILDASRRSFSVLTALGGEFGVRNRVGSVPALLASAGIVHVRVPALTTKERVQLETALGA